MNFSMAVICVIFIFLSLFSLLFLFSLFIYLMVLVINFECISIVLTSTPVGAAMRLSALYSVFICK